MPPTTDGDATGDSIWDLIDRDATLARLAQDESLLRELADFFLDDQQPLVDTLTAALERADPAAVEGAAHSLKGMAANLGATAAARAAGELEAMGRARDLSTAAGKQQALLAEIDRLVGALRSYRETE